MKKKMLSLALALILALALVPSAFAAEVSAADKFTDVPANAWYLDELNYAVANGYISGTSATTFSPDATITRGQFVTILGRMLNVSTSGGSTKFTDVDAGSWYAPYVAWAAQNGYVNGTSSTTFSPEATITVEQMGTILANYIGKSGVTLSGYTASVSYKDEYSISAWASANMDFVRQYGLMVTDTSGNVNPHKSVSRAEGAVSLVRLAKATGLGVEPVIEQKPVVTQKPVSVKRSDIVQSSDTAETAAQKIHDALWAAGMLNSSMTQKEKAEVYFDWMQVKGNCEYDWSFSKGRIHDAYGALVNGWAVCDGITYGYNMLLATEGIECSSAYTKDHEWTTVTLDGVLCHIDATVGIFCVEPDLMWRVQNARQYELDTGDDSQIEAIYKELHWFWYADTPDEW